MEPLIFLALGLFRLRTLLLDELMDVSPLPLFSLNALGRTLRGEAPAMPLEVTSEG